MSVPQGTTLFDAARSHGIPIPTLCHQQNETPVGVCRVCVVDVGGRVLAASCVRPAENKMVVSTNSEKVTRARRTLLELLMADHPSPCARQSQSNDCELETLARLEGIAQPRFPRRISPRGQDNSSLRHRGGSRSLHSLRPLHSRLRRDSPQRRPWPARQGLSGGHRVRYQPAHGQLLLRFLRRVHGVVSHRSAH